MATDMGEQNDLDAVTPVAGQISLRSQILDPKDRVFDFHAGRFESRNPLGGNVEPGAKVDRPASPDRFDDWRYEFQMRLLVVGEHYGDREDFPAVRNEADSVGRIDNGRRNTLGDNGLEHFEAISAIQRAITNDGFFHERESPFQRDKSRFWQAA
jgi:hypothetical protein